MIYDLVRTVSPWGGYSVSNIRRVGYHTHDFWISRNASDFVIIMDEFRNDGTFFERIAGGRSWDIKGGMVYMVISPEGKIVFTTKYFIGTSV